MSLRVLILMLIFILPMKANAGLILEAFGGQAQDTGEGIDKLNGNVIEKEVPTHLSLSIELILTSELTF